MPKLSRSTTRGARSPVWVHPTWPNSALILVLCGVILMGMGLYFLVLRPPLLPEDLRFIGASSGEVQTRLPGLVDWVRKVLWVLGGSLLTTGLLTVSVAGTSFRSRTRGARAVMGLAGVTSIGWMALVNGLLKSTFTGLLVLIALLWASALVLSWFEVNTRARRMEGAAA